MVDHSVDRRVQVTGFGYEHDAPWAANVELFKQFTDETQGVRRLGAAAVDLCHVALGVVDAYWCAKPWFKALRLRVRSSAHAGASPSAVEHHLSGCEPKFSACAILVFSRHRANSLHSLFVRENACCTSLNWLAIHPASGSSVAVPSEDETGVRSGWRVL